MQLNSGNINKWIACFKINILNIKIIFAVLSVGLGWGGVYNTYYVTVCPVCGVGVEWGLQHRPCYVQSCRWSSGGVGFATQTVLRAVLSVGVGVGVATQNMVCAILSVGLGWGGVCNTDHVMCGPVCGGWGGPVWGGGGLVDGLLHHVGGVGVGWGLLQRPC